MDDIAVNGVWGSEGDSLGESQAFQFGYGLFETIRIQENQPLHWDAHMARLRDSAGALGFSVAPDTKGIERWLQKLLSERPKERCALKLIWSAHEGRSRVSFHFRPIPYGQSERRNGFKACIGDIRRNPHSHVTRHKTLNYLDNLLERNRAKALGFDEAILLNDRGEATEGTASNLFVQIGEHLVTPPVSAGILPGIQRQAILNACDRIGMACREEPLQPEQLLEAEALYLTNTLMGLMPVSDFSGKCYDRDDMLVAQLNALTGIAD